MNNIDRFVQWAFEPTFWRLAFWLTVIAAMFSAVGLFALGWAFITAVMFVVVIIGWVK